MALSFVNLIDDVLLRILHECSALEVLALERTCRTFRNLLSQPYRPLWLSLIQEIQTYQAPNISPFKTISSLSSKELKDIVTKSSLGSKNWQSSSPRAVRRHVIDLRNRGRLMGNLTDELYIRENIRLCAGGEFAGVLWSAGYFQLWNTSRKSCIWTYPALGDFPSFQVEAFDLYVEHLHNESLVMSFCGKYIGTPSTSKFLAIYQLDISSKKIKRMASTTFILPRSVPTVIDMKASSDFIVLFGLDGFLLFDPSLKRSLSVEAVLKRYSSQLMGRHIFALVQRVVFGQPTEWEIIVMDGKALLSRAKLLGSETAVIPPVYMKDIPCSKIAIIGDGPESFDELCICPCLPTWRNERTVAITVLGKTIKETKETCFRALKYHFLPGDVDELGPNARGTIWFGGSGPSNIRVPFASPFSVESVFTMSQTGRCILSSTNNLHKATRYYAFSIAQLLNGDPKFGQIIFGRDIVGPSVLHMDYYSGAIAYPTKGERNLVIEYFD